MTARAAGRVAVGAGRGLGPAVRGRATAVYAGGIGVDSYRVPVADARRRRSPASAPWWRRASRATRSAGSSAASARVRRALGGLADALRLATGSTASAGSEGALAEAGGRVRVARRGSPCVLVRSTLPPAAVPGRPPAHARWRPVAWCAASASPAASSPPAVRPGTARGLPRDPEPVRDRQRSARPAAGRRRSLLLLIGARRRRRFAGPAVPAAPTRLQRQQIKWLPLGGSGGGRDAASIGTAGYDVWGERRSRTSRS